MYTVYMKAASIWKDIIEFYSELCLYEHSVQCERNEIIVTT